MSERAAPFFCPYCADEDMRPVAEPRGAWACAACLRVFVVTFVGLTGRDGPLRSESEPTEVSR